MKNWFSHLAHNAAHLFRRVFSTESLTALQQAGQMAELYLAPALQAVETINSLAPNRTLEQIVHVGQQYELHVTPELYADPVQVETVLQNAAVKILLQQFPAASHARLRDAIGGAYAMLQAVQKTSLPTAPGPVTGGVGSMTSISIQAGMKNPEAEDTASNGGEPKAFEIPGGEYKAGQEFTVGKEIEVTSEPKAPAEAPEMPGSF